MEQRVKSTQEKIQNLWTAVKARPMEAALTALLVIQAGLILFSNLTLIEREMNCDAAKLLRHIIIMAQEKTLVIPDWTYTTTLEWDCTTLFALPIYMLTHDIYLSCALSNEIFLGILIAVFFFLFAGEKKIYPLLWANLVCLPYKVGETDYYNMLFFAGTQYIVKVMVPLLLIGILLNMERKNHNKVLQVWRSCFTVLYTVLLLLTSMSSSMYVAACGMVPIWVVYLGYKFFRWRRVPKQAVVLLGGSVTCVLVGMVVNNAVAEGSMATQMVICNTKALLENVSSCFFGLFEVLGGTTLSTEVTVFSFDGILIFMKIILMAAILILALTALVKCIKKQGDLRLLLLLAVFLWNYFILNIIDTKYGAQVFENRYHLIGLLPLICVAVIILIQTIQKMRLQQIRVLYVGIFLVLTVLTGASFLKLFQRGEQNENLREIIRYCEESDVEVIYMFYDSYSAEVCRMLDDDHLYLELRGDATTKVHDYYSKYDEAPMQTENAIVMIKESTEGAEDTFYIANKLLVKFDTIAGRNLYYFAAE